MAKYGFNWYNDAYEREEGIDFDPTEGMNEAELMAYYDRQEQGKQITADIKAGRCTPV